MAKRILVLQEGKKVRFFTIKICPPKKIKGTKARRRRLRAEQAAK